MRGDLLVGTLILIALAAVVMQAVQAAEEPAELKMKLLRFRISSRTSQTLTASTL